METLVALALSSALGAPGALRTVEVPPPPVLAFPAQPPPDVDADAWMVWSVGDDAEIGSLDPDTRRAPASITKLMTAILVVERAALTNIVPISANADATPIGYAGQPDVRRGEEWTVIDLLANILVQSGNDAAVALAEHVAGDVDAFVELMNERAAALGMGSTEFRNPNGLDADGHLSTARDLIVLGREALEHPAVLRVARIEHISFDPGGRVIEVDATNRDLGIFPGLLGLKTGDTLRAGQVLLSYHVGSHGRHLAVVLASSDRRSDTRELLAWADTTLGPRDRFLAPLAGSDLALLFPDWYQTRLLAPAPLPNADPTPPERTPLLDDVDGMLAELLPAVLGGSP